jgi:hypothetical protein
MAADQNLVPESPTAVATVALRRSFFSVSVASAVLDVVALPARVAGARQCL